MPSSTEAPDQEALGRLGAVRWVKLARFPDPPRRTRARAAGADALSP